MCLCMCSSCRYSKSGSGSSRCWCGPHTCNCIISRVSCWHLLCRGVHDRSKRLGPLSPVTLKGSQHGISIRIMTVIKTARQNSETFIHRTTGMLNWIVKKNTKISGLYMHWTRKWDYETIKWESHSCCPVIVFILTVTVAQNTTRAEP